jgi:outer membrane protein assembly factor BamA
VLTHTGYLGVKSSPVRSLQQESHIVNLEIKVSKGRQFLFGSLQLSGLTSADQESAAKLWRLTEGAPMDGPYVDDYLRGVFKALKGPTKSVSTKLSPRANTNVVDVIIAFK